MRAELVWDISRSLRFLEEERIIHSIHTRGAAISRWERLPFTLQLFQRQRPEHLTCFLFIWCYYLFYYRVSKKKKRKKRAKLWGPRAHFGANISMKIADILQHHHSGFPAKWRLKSEHRNSFKETGNYSSRHSIFFSVVDETGKDAEPKRVTRIGGIPCSCFLPNCENGTFWWPICPSGWETCFSAFPYGECCIKQL